MISSRSQQVETTFMDKADSSYSQMHSSLSDHDVDSCSCNGRISSTKISTVHAIPRVTAARNRWRQLKHTMTFVKLMSTYIKSAPMDLSDERRVEEHLHEQLSGNRPYFCCSGRISPTKSPTAHVTPQVAVARNRWRRLKHTVTFAKRMSTYIKSAPRDLLDERRVEELLHEQLSESHPHTASFEGPKPEPRAKPKGRKGMEGLIVRQEKHFVSIIQDLYVACLKMPISLFLAGVFLAPIALSLLFTPIYLFDMEGLAFDEVTSEELVSGVGNVKQRCYTFLNVFLFALSLSTTFSGSPVVALSPYCLLVANVNTLMAQFLFVFLSGAVFARMSQPSHPIRCSKKAIIRTNDFVPPVPERNEIFRVFAVRLVLTGAAPCELVDAKIHVTFRILIKLPSGSSFLSTEDLELVRPEVSYLRYGLMVRHIIDKRSPVYGHTMDSLTEGDASFSLTIMGLERTSMQPVFHLQDYFVCDGDVIWDGDFEEFIEINDKGQRVLHHSKIDLLKFSKGIVSSSEMYNKAETRPEGNKNGSLHIPDFLAEHKIGKSSLYSWWSLKVQNQNLWRRFSCSFTHAQWS